MGIVKGSVTIATPNTGNYQVQMPEADLDVIGIAPLGVANQYLAPPIIGIYIDASNIAYFPMPQNSSYTVRKYSPIHVKLKGTVLNLNIPFNAQGGLTIFYGTPDGTEIEYSLLKGVPFIQINTSTTSNESGTLTINFPAGNVKIVGIFLLGLNAGGYGNVSFQTGTGTQLNIPFGTSPDPMDIPDNILALDLTSATTLSLNYSIGYNASGNATLIGIVYYE